MPQATVTTPQGINVSITFDKEPDLCPVCLHSIQPIVTNTLTLCISQTDPTGYVLQVAYRCPSKACAALLIAQYSQIPQQANKYGLSKLMPLTPRQADFDESIGKVSPAFIKIYNQAIAAEAANLDEVCGVGLGKALEFLVKDYCIRKNPTKAEEIKRSFLGNCIKDFVTDPNIKTCAERAIWLRNDETHYVRTWSNHDIDDLKSLVKLTVNWIVSEMLTERYLTAMSKQPMVPSK